MYTLDKNSAKKADQVGKWLTETGKYIGTIVTAEDIVANTGTRGIVLTLRADDGRETRQFIYTEKSNGDRLTGFDLVMALMTCLKLRDIKPVSAKVKRWDNDAKQEYVADGQVFPELANKRIGFLLQKTEEVSRKDPNDTAWSAKLVAVFEANTELMASEILDGKKSPEALTHRVAQLADRPMRKRPAGSQTSRSYSDATNGNGFEQDDDIPF
ncbi:hypothetical protein [Pandoraea terrigena]|uniref:Uncharacterized protein n=1 Tax=Pandoraea terrigena TaxID=2508292 RepID=A0A5E4V4Q5_9BURK|nr:hypothetical protein [Pandoraea terrigena]VVE06813.1 hypothetical protein PTE31013_02432 [Pandoraea terrigena]